MAANKFATMLHRNTNKITLILVYTLLEWILIILLLLNSLFSFLIIKFADYFGLKTPCLWCSRLDHLLEPGKNKNSHRDLVCETHANEISKLGYCSNHQKLAESQDMCEDCSSQPDSEEWSKKFAFFPWMKQIGVIQGGDEKVIQNGDENLNCSCCGMKLNKFYPPCILIKPSWEVLDYTQKQSLTMEAGVDAQTEEGDHSDQSRSDFIIDQHEDEEAIEVNRKDNTIFDVDGGCKRREDEAEEHSACSVCDYGCKEIVANEDDKVDRVIEEQEPIKEANLNVSMDDQPRDHQTFIQASCDNGLSPEILPQHLEFYIDQDDCRLVLVDLIDSPTTTELQSHKKYKVEDQGNSSYEDVILDFGMCFEAQAKPVVESWRSSEESVTLLSFHESKEEGRASVLDSEDLGENRSSSSVFQGEEGGIAKEENEPVATTQATQTSSQEDDDDDDDDGQSNAAIARDDIDSDVHQAFEDDVYMHNDEIDAEVSIGTEIPDQEPIDEMQLAQEFLHSSYPCAQEDPSTSCANLHACDHHGSKQAEEELLKFKTFSAETGEEAKENHFSLGSEFNEIEEEKVPDTPTSIDSLHQLHKELLLFERREVGTEESLDGSVLSDIEGGDGVMTIEKLKTVLRAERKALNELYAELEEERSASAVAASQTMAMINRLQEEKAAMQMEALQYQRMMEEQSEYDQEAMQLLNELMVKREKEKQEVERELEICRKKVQDYEAKERMMILRRMKDGSTRSRSSSGPCSNAEDSDGLSIDLNNESKEEDSREEGSNQNTPTDAVLYLEESLASFEEEKLSILDQLKELEEKLLTLSDEEEEHFQNMKPIKYFLSENGNGYHEKLDVSSEVNGVANGHSKEMNGKHNIKGSKGKRLLPLFDAIEAEAEDGELELNGDTGGYDSFASQDFVIKFEEENKKFAIEEEVGHVYERLQALEADREFLKHCISSLRKGDKGLVLLQEILEHLRDLRSVELRLRTTGDSVL
ncbi:hypothetical protein PRUPE_1G330400 [Prunus persica]|uniref:Uncharacterized protein n=1 Tax=Prunus persica TaxID=3760 RepID=M5Y1T3_PRUPE|nr:myosin-binding protein 3 isoform X1 [Prunus persica]ONI31779.1 hypothetical protein PRUPE_1G330400 [Prunus persica]